MKTWLLVISAIALSACVVQSPSQSPTPKAEFLKMTNRTFVSPSDGMNFRLSLGKRLYQDTGGITQVPSGISGIRQATASFYSVEDENGSGYGDAESSISEGLDHFIQYIKVQHEPTSGIILVTEDTSDALPGKRYILFTPTRPGYSVHYLAPDYDISFEEGGPPSSPPEVVLLPDDRAWIDGKIIPISRIPKSTHPFSLGG